MHSSPCKARPKPKFKAFPKAEVKRTPRQPSHSPPPERVAPWKRKKKIDEVEKKEEETETQTEEKKEEPEEQEKQEDEQEEQQEQKTTEAEPAPSSSSSGVVYHGVTDAVMKLGE